MIYTAARQKSRRQQAPLVPAVIFYTRIPHPKANWRSTKRTGKTEKTGTKQKKNTRHSEQFGNKLFIYK